MIKIIIDDNLEVEILRKSDLKSDLAIAQEIVAGSTTNRRAYNLDISTREVEYYKTEENYIPDGIDLYGYDHKYFEVPNTDNSEDNGLGGYEGGQDGFEDLADDDDRGEIQK